MENPVQNILSRIDASTLPVVPGVLLDLINATHKTNVSFKELSQIIAQDASLSSKVLATANSPYYRQWGEMTNLSRVITVLGLNTIKTIAITRTVQQFFCQIPEIHHDFLEVIWYRSLNCAYLAQKIAKMTGYEFPEEAYLTGLIHRIGQLVLLKCFPKEYPYFLAEHFNDQEQMLEKQTFGATHQEIGAFLIGTWNIRTGISEAVLQQSQPAEMLANSDHLNKIINLANHLACSNLAKPSLYFLADKFFGLHQPLLEELLAEVRNLVEQSAESLGIVITNQSGARIKSQTPEFKRKEIQLSVAEYVKEIALSSVFKQELAPDPNNPDLISVIRRDMNVLFGIKVATVFLWNQATEQLVSAPEEQIRNDIWPVVAIGAKPDPSLLVKAWKSGQIAHTFSTNKSDPISMIDRQLAQILGTEGLLSIPLIAEKRTYGVIVAGINRTDLAMVGSASHFIQLFAGEAANILERADSTSPSATDSLSEAHQNFLLHIRKLVHEANNPLTVINNYLYLLNQKLGDDYADEIRIIREEIDRVGNIILKLPDAHEHQINEENSLLNVNVIIQDLVNLFLPGIFKTHNINTVLKLDDTLPKISSSRSKLKQILTNLIKNAAEAMFSGGTLTISTQDRVSYQGKEYIEIRVQDTGPGVSREITNHLFMPVSSTKGNGHSGLGLTISKNLIDELKGVIECTSSTGNGTTFRILLPRKQGVT